MFLYFSKNFSFFFLFLKAKKEKKCKNKYMQNNAMHESMIPKTDNKSSMKVLL